MDPFTTEASSGRSQTRFVVVALLLVVLAVIAYFALGMPGMDHSVPASPADHEQMDM